jgi:hypothetical protein
VAAFGFYLFGMNYGGVTFTIYLIPIYLILAIFLGCGLSAVHRWFSGVLAGRSKWVALPLRASMAGLILLMPMYGVWQNWATVDQSDNVTYRDMAERFVEQAGPDFVLVDSEPHYDDLEAILYTAWGVKDWRQAQWVPPGGIDQWLGRRPVYAWSDGAAYHGDYVEEPVPELPGMVRIVGRQEE